jgi:tight adherence protein B
MDETFLLPIAAFVAIVATVGAILFGLRDLFSPRRAKRLELKQLVRILPRERDGVPNGVVERFDRWFALLLYQSGLGLGAGSAVLLFLICAGGLGGFVFLITDEIPLSFVAGLAMIPCVMGLLVNIRRRRMKKFEEQFPNSLDILARAVRAGESVEQAMELVSKSTQEPVASEYRRCSNQLEMGLSVPATVQSLGDRIGQSDVKIFSSTLSIHRDGGGNLAESLERLASLIRDRLDYRRQMNSVTSGGRFSVLVILVLAPLLFAYLFLIRPEYGMGLWEDSIGRWMLVTSLAGQFLGMFWVSQILKNDY